MLVKIKSTWQPALLVVLLLATAIPVHGQLVGRPIGDDPAYWWTLTDEISPEQLREELQSREKSRERLRAAIEAGLHGPVSGEQLADLSFFIQGRLTPELVPMWEAFDSWSSPLDYLPGWEDTLRRHLSESDLSEDGAALVIAVSHDHNVTAAAIMNRLGTKASRYFTEVLKPARQRLGRAAANASARNRDYDRLAAISGKPKTEVADLHTAWNTDPAAEASIAAIKELRRILSDEDWNALRACLLKTTAHDIERFHYGPEAFR